MEDINTEINTDPTLLEYQDRQITNSLKVPSSAEWGIIHQTKPPILTIVSHSGTCLIRIHPDGSVGADSIEAASEAGKIFVESLRQQMRMSLDLAMSTIPDGWQVDWIQQLLGEENWTAGLYRQDPDNRSRILRHAGAGLSAAQALRDAIAKITLGEAV